jgi:hypothetical protein
MNLKLSQQEAEILSGPYTQEDRISAVKLGFARAIADSGMTPSEAEELFKQASISKIAGLAGMQALSTAGEWAAKYPVLLALLGAGAGAGIGKLHNALDARSEDKQDEESITLKKKMETYQNMKKELAEAMGAGNATV